MLASPIFHQPTPSPVAPVSTTASLSDDLSPPLDFGALSTPVPEVALHPPPSPPPSRPASITEKRQRRRSRLPSFFARLSSSPARSLRTDKHSDAKFHTTVPSESPPSAPSAHPGDTTTSHYSPRHEPHSNSLHTSATFSPIPRDPSLVALPTSRSRSPSATSSSRRPSDTQTLSQVDRCPEIFLTTTACRLSVPLTALRSLESITEQDISRKMHQTSSRLLRMTDDERPYTRVCPNNSNFIYLNIVSFFIPKSIIFYNISCIHILNYISLLPFGVTMMEKQNTNLKIIRTSKTFSPLSWSVYH
jgi:hypothetical protein